MSVFVDSSAFVAMLNSEDEFHAKADRAWRDLVDQQEVLFTTNYVVLELCAILQRRFGLDAVQLWATVLMPALVTYCLDGDEHRAALSAVLAANRRGLSLVDCASFLAMRSLGISRVFTFDHHFAEQGFEVLPAARRPR